MNLYFGKVSQKFDLNQIEEGYYEAPKNSTWFDDLKIGDYVYLIGGGKIQFWKAKEWRKVNGLERLYFDVLNNNLNINVNDLISIKFFKLTKLFIILTSRSARNRAFFKIEKFEDIVNDKLADSDFYKNDDIYRKIRIVKEGDIDSNSNDIQIYLKNDQLRIANNPFMDEVVINSFRDNLKYQGQGLKHKDSTLAKVKENLHQNTIFTNEQLGLRAFYDAFFCEYAEMKKYFLVGAFWKGHMPEDMTNTFVEESRWENGYDDKFTERVKQIPEGTSIAIKAAYVKNKTQSVIKIKARGTVMINHGDGKNIDVTWDDNFMPFEVQMGNYRHTIHEVTNRDHIENIWKNETSRKEDMYNYEILDLLKFKKQIILQGPPGTGKTKLAKEISKYLVANNIVIKNPNTQLDHCDIPKILNIGEEITSVAGNTSYIIVQIENDEIKLKGSKKNIGLKTISFEKILGYLDNKDIEEHINNGDDRGAAALAKAIRERLSSWYSADSKKTQKLVQFHPSYTYEDFVRGIVSKPDISGKVITYSAENQTLAVIAMQAMIDPSNNYVLVIDEINRANLSSVLGELIYALEYRDEPVESIYGVENDGKQLVLPSNLYIIGTMNTADRSVGHIDYAIRRRFAFVNVLPKVLNEETLSNGQKFAKELFIEVGKLFVADYTGQIIEDNQYIQKSVHLSGEFDPKEVMLGHSYFIEKTDCPMRIRLKYEIIPILMEYVKDGILKESAISVIKNLTV